MIFRNNSSNFKMFKKIKKQKTKKLMNSLWKNKQIFIKKVCFLQMQLHFYVLQLWVIRF